MRTIFRNADPEQAPLVPGRELFVRVLAVTVIGVVLVALNDGHGTAFLVGMVIGSAMAAGSRPSVR